MVGGLKTVYCRVAAGGDGVKVGGIEARALVEKFDLGTGMSTVDVSLSRPVACDEAGDSD